MESMNLYQRKPQDLVSVIIINFNYGKYLKEAIQSALGQTHPHIEVIVVDNGSTDESSQVIQVFGDTVKAIYLPRNLGQAMARNIGAEHAKGMFLSFLDSDDYWDKTKIAKQIKKISAENQLIYCGAREYGLVRSKYLMPKYAGDCGDDFLNPAMEAVVVCGESTVLMTRHLFNQIGGFRHQMNRASGWDFFRRCSFLTRFAYIEEALTNYRRHPASESTYFLEGMLDRQRAYRIAIRESIKLSRKRKLILLYRFFRVCVKSIILHFSSLIFRKGYTANRNDINLRKFILSSVRIWGGRA